MAGVAEIPSLIAALSRDLTAAGIEHVITGASAMTVHGYVRATRDIDVLVAAPSVRLPEVFAIVRRYGFSGEDRDLIQELRTRSFAELRSPGASVDILVPELPYHHTLVGRAVTRSVSGQLVPFVSVEDLIVLKMLWHRTKDVPDVHALVAAAAGTLDREYVVRTLDALLPESDARHAEMVRVLDAVGG